MIKKIFSKSIVLFISTLLSRGFVFLLNVILARHSSSSVYGMFALIKSSINMFGTTLSSSIEPQVIKISSENNRNKTKKILLFILLFVFIITLFLCIGLFAFSETISYAILKGSYKWYVILSSFVIMTSILNGVVTSISIARELYKKIFFSAVISFTIGVLFSIYIISYYLITGVLLSIILFNLIDFLIKFLYLIKNKYLLLTKEDTFDYYKIVINIFLKPSSLIIIASMINAIVFWWARLRLSNFKNGFDYLAHFDVAYQFIVLTMMVLNVVTTVLLVDMVKSINQNKKTMIQVLIYNLSVVMIMVLPVIVGLYLFSPYLISIFGENYDSEILNQLAVLPMFYAVAIVLNRFMIAIEMNKILVHVSIFSSITMLLYVLFYVNSAIKLGNAFIIYYATSVVVYLFFVLKYKKKLNDII